MGKSPKASHKPPKVVPVTDISDRSTKIVFSFEYLDMNNSKYSFEELKDTRIEKQFHSDFHKKMKEYCEKSDFKKSLSEKEWKKRNHIHPIDWSDHQIRESCFTSLNKELMEQIKNDCWQLGINNNGFRMHGFFIGNVFYIVWLDPLHRLYPSK